MARKLGQTALVKHEGMTLQELALFVQEAMRMDIEPNAKVKVTNGFRRQIQVLEVEG